MKNKENDLEMFSFDEIKDEFIGQIGSQKRTLYEQELQLDILSALIKKVRLERNMTQEQLGKLIGVQRAQISKLENNISNVSINTLLRVFSALKTKVYFNVEILNSNVKVAG